MTCDGVRMVFLGRIPPGVECLVLVSAEELDVLC